MYAELPLSDVRERTEGHQNVKFSYKVRVLLLIFHYKVLEWNEKGRKGKDVCQG